MAINSLFDDKRKQRVRDALKKGDLGPIFRKKSKPERLPPESGDHETEHFGRVPGSESGMLELASDPAQYNLNGKIYRADELLLLAIIFNDPKAAAMAIEGGANVNLVFDRFPPSPPGSETDLSQIPPFPECSVLRLAQGTKCRSEIEKLLIDNGAEG